MSPTLLAGFDEQREADEVDGGCDGQRADESEHKTHQPRKTHQELEQRGHQDGSLDLGTTRDNSEQTMQNLGREALKQEQPEKPSRTHRGLIRIMHVNLCPHIPPD